MERIKNVWKRRISFILSLALLFTMFPDVWTSTMVVTAEGENNTVEDMLLLENVAIHTKATANADYSNGNSVPKNVNNGYLATNDPETTWNTWKMGGAVYPAPIWLEWKTQYELTGMRIIWWADDANIDGNDHVTFPKSCEVEYLDDNGDWKKITGMMNEEKQTVDTVGVLFNRSDGNGVNGSNKQWNTVLFPEKITTKKLRLLIERNGSGNNGVGISEWEVYGVKKGTGEEKVNIAGSATVTADYSNAGTSTENINNGKLAEGSGTTWNTWCNDGNLTYPYYVTMKWKKERTLSSAKVMWWADDEKAGTPDGDGVLFPKSCKIQYWDKKQEQWITVEHMTDENKTSVDTVGVKCGSETAEGNAVDCLNEKNRYWNEVIFPQEIQTNQIRLEIERQENASEKSGIGIGEWEVYGEDVEDSIVTGINIAPAAKVSADYSNTGTSAEKVNDMKYAEGSATTWNTWKEGGDLDYPQPITLTWENPYDISSMRIMWWADDEKAGDANDGVLFPKECKVYYFDYESNDWKQITSMENEEGTEISSVGTAGNGLNGTNRTWNGVVFNESVKTTKLQLRIERQDNVNEKSGIGIGEWEVYGKEIKDEFVGAQITGKNKLVKNETSVYYAKSVPDNVSGNFSYQWTIPEESKNILKIIGTDNQEKVSIEAAEKGDAFIKLEMTLENETKSESKTAQIEYKVTVEEITDIESYNTTTVPGKAPILPDTVVANGITFDESTPSLKSKTRPDYDFGETFDSKLVPVIWDKVPEEKYSKAGAVFTVEGTVENTDKKAIANITVKEPAKAAVENSTITFENVKLTDDFWQPKQKVNALNSLNKAIAQIKQSSGGEPNFDNAIKKLNGEPYEQFSGLVFQDTDIYKTLEAISYTLSVIDEDNDAEIVAQKEKLEKTLDEWVSKIEQVQYADGYINTFFTLRSKTYEGGRASGTHRWLNMSNHEMYVGGHFLESVVAYTRYREGIGDPDYRLYVAGKRYADHIVEWFGPNGKRHEVPGHEEIELALVKFAKLVEEQEGEGTGDKYVQTAKILIDRRGEDYTLRESGYQGYTDGVRDYSQDAKPFTEETNAVGHAVRATYLYTGATDVARLLPEGDKDKEAYLTILDTIWDSVANRKTYITGGIGVASHGEDFGGDYELPSNDSYNEICASIALTNWNQRMNLVHEDAKYADVMERALYNGILVGTNLEGDKFYYANKLEIPNKWGITDGGMYGGVQRQDWFTCACCPPNLMRTIAKLSEYIYTTHGDKVFVNLFIGSDGNLNVDGTNVNLIQETEYPWEGSIGITVTPEQAKTFTMKIRIPSWVKEQDNKTVSIKVNGEAVSTEEENGYVAITREWNKQDVIQIDMPMEVRKTEPNENVKDNQGKIAIERGPIVYAVEKAGNAQLNSTISNFDPRNFVIPRNSELTAKYEKDLLKGVVEITGDVTYQNGGQTVNAKLQAVPFYASNNRGDSNTYQPDAKSTGMTVWTNASGEPSVKYTVTFNAKEGTLSETERKVTSNTAVGTLPIPVKEGYEFKGWYTTEEDGEKVTEQTIITGDITIYARWERNAVEEPENKTHTITYVLNDGVNASNNPASFKESEEVLLRDPTRNGYTFGGWYSDDTFTKAVIKIEKGTTENITVYAKWNIISNNNGNSSNGSSSNNSGTTSSNNSSGTVNNGTTNNPKDVSDNTPEPETPSDESQNKPVDTVVTEKKPDGTIVETKKETQESGAIKETVKETYTDGTVSSTVTNTKPDGTTITTKEIVAGDNSAVLTATIDAGSKNVTAVIRTGTSNNSSLDIPKMMLKEIAEDSKLSKAIIEVTDITVDSVASDSKNKVVNLNIPFVENAEVEKVVLTQEGIKTAKETGKGLIINVINGNADKAGGSYTVTIPAKQLAKIDAALKELNITISTNLVEDVTDTSKKNAITKVINKSSAKKEKTCVVSLAENKNINAGMKVSIPITEKTAISVGNKVYVYKYDIKTGKLIETANCKQNVGSDGSIVIAAASGTDYVVSAKKLTGNKVETIEDGISVSVSKKNIKVGKTIAVQVTLPDTVSRKNEFGKEKAAITYKSDSKIAAVSKSGVVTAKKKGKITITTTIKLSSGQKIVKKKNLTIK